jgi:hypothetical protein
VTPSVHTTTKPAERQASKTRPSAAQRPSAPAPGGYNPASAPPDDALGRMLQRAVSRRAGQGRVLARMTDEVAAAAATESKADGTPEEHLEKARLKQRYEPKAKLWFVPEDESLWDEYWALWQRSKGKMGQTFAVWAPGRKVAIAKEVEQEKLRAVGRVKPFNLQALRDAAGGGSEAGAAQALAIWGADARFDKLGQAAVIRKMFEYAGYTVSAVEESTRTSSWTPPVLIKLTHPVIKDIELHPGGGIHGTVKPQGKDGVGAQVVGNGPPYIRIETSDKQEPIKLRNKALPEDVNYHARGQHATYVHVNIPVAQPVVVDPSVIT